MTEPGRHSKLPNLHLSESGFLFDPYSGLTYGLNRTGTRILALLRSGVERDEIPRRLAAEFDVPETTARADFAEFCDTLGNEGLL